MRWPEDADGWPLRQYSRHVLSRPHRWHVQEAGEGETLLLIHGAGGATQSWRDLFPRLAEAHHVVADGVDELVAPDPPIDCPTLVMTGDEDHGNSPKMSEAIAAEIPGSSLVILPGLRHMALAEAPELVNPMIVEFAAALDR